MPKAKNPKANKAEALFREGLKLIEIAKQLDVPAGTVRRWKNTYGWQSERSDKKKANVRKKRGAPKGNSNATGAPAGNKRSEKYGFFSKYLPDETKEIFDAVDNANPLDLLWHQIQISYAAIIRAQRIAYVKDQEDKTIERVEERSGRVIGSKWEVQQAWNKQNDFLKAQARAQGELRNLIKQYDDMLHHDWELATDEQKARVDKLKAEAARIGGDEEIEYLDDIESDVYGDNKA